MSHSTKYSNLPMSKLALAISSVLLLSTNAFADEVQPQSDDNKLEVIQVTAQKRVQSIQDVPMSITAFNGDTIEDGGIKNLSQLSDYVPNLTISKSVLNTNIYMRGVGSGNNRGFEQSVGMFIDGVYMGRSRQFDSPFLDLERAEVLRGPQGILFGKNTIAGALNLSTAKAYAGDEFSGSITADYDPEHADKSLVGIFSGSVSDELGLRLAVRNRSSDGYMENKFLGRDEAQSDEQAIRLSANWEASSDLNIHLKLEHSEVDTVGSSAEIIALTPLDPIANFIAGVTLPATDPNFEAQPNHKRSSDDQQIEEFSSNEADNIALNIEYSVGNGTLNFVTGYSTYDFKDGKSTDFLPIPFIINPEAEEFEQVSQEIRYATSGTNKFDYITGIFYQDSTLENNFYSSLNTAPIEPLLIGLFSQPGTAGLIGSSDPTLSLTDLGIAPESITRVTEFNQDTETLSAFFQGTYNVSDDFRVIFGGRYTEETKSVSRYALINRPGLTNYDPANISGPNGLITAAALKVGVTLPEYEKSRDEEHFTPSLKLQYDINPDVMAYFTAEKGFKSGGFNSAPDATLENSEFEEESAVGVEFGMKTDLLDGAARFNFAVFRTEFDDLQVTTWNGFGFEVGNAAESVTQGLEVDGIVLLNDYFTLSGSLSYLDSYYKNYAAGPCTAYDLQVEGKSQCDLSGEATPFAPEYSASIFLEYATELTEDLELSATLNLNYSDEFFYDIDLDENLMQEATTKVNLSVKLAAMDDSWDISLIGKNLTDELTYAAGADVPLLAGGYVGYADAPRTISIQGSYRF